MQALFFTLYIVLHINLRSALHTALHKGKKQVLHGKLGNDVGTGVPGKSFA